jgi:hypothetical protein
MSYSEPKIKYLNISGVELRLNRLLAQRDATDGVNDRARISRRIKQCEVRRAYLLLLGYGQGRKS